MFYVLFSRNECMLVIGSSPSGNFSQRNVSTTINTGVELRPGHAHHQTHIPATLHTISLPQQQTNTQQSVKISTQQRFSLVNIYSYIPMPPPHSVHWSQICIQRSWSCCISCMHWSLRPCPRSSTGCSWLLFTCFCFHLVCLIHLMKGCHGNRCLGWGYPCDAYMAVSMWLFRPTS